MASFYLVAVTCDCNDLSTSVYADTAKAKRAQGGSDKPAGQEKQQQMQAGSASEAEASEEEARLRASALLKVREAKAKRAQGGADKPAVGFRVSVGVRLV